ncbi:hypothetical protein A5N71_11370 [Prescottella equi]|nr:hypothetical protein A5N71_11370 [Prescottella equi]
MNHFGIHTRSEPRSRVVVEVDGREFHSGPEVFHSGRKRQNWLVRQGWPALASRTGLSVHPFRVARESAREAQE